MKILLKSITLIISLVALSSITFAGYQYTSYHSQQPYHSKNYPRAKQPVYRTVVDAAVASPNLSTLVTALKKAGLVSALQQRGPFIVFAPTNQAFNQLPAGQLNRLLQRQNRQQLQNILKYHVVPTNFTTLQGRKLMVSISSVNHVRVIKTVKTGNGTVYVINRVLLP